MAAWTCAVLSPATGQMVSLTGTRRNRHAAAAVSGVRGVVDGVALLVRHVDEPAIDAGIDPRRRRREILRLRRALATGTPAPSPAAAVSVEIHGCAWCRLRAQTTATGFSSVPIPEMVMRTRIAGFERERIGRDDAGAGQQHRAVRECLRAEQILDELRERPFDLSGPGLAGKHRLAAASDLELNASTAARRLPSARRRSTDRRRTRRCRSSPAADRAGSRPRCRASSCRCRS